MATLTWEPDAFAWLWLSAWIVSMMGIVFITGIVLNWEPTSRTNTEKWIMDAELSVLINRLNEIGVDTAPIDHVSL
jgi:hypothetical protein